MWLLLAAAGTGYFARCWQKARKHKSGSSVSKHKAALNRSQRSPSCTPRRGRSTNRSRCGSHKQSRSAKSRKLLPGRSEGRSARNHIRDWDDNFGSSEKFFEELLCSDDDLSGQCKLSALKDQDTSGKVQTSSQINNLNGLSNLPETYPSLNSMCVRDHWRDMSSWMEQPLRLTADIDAKELLFCIYALSNKKPNFETLYGCSAAALDVAENWLNMEALFSKNGLDCAKPTGNSLIASDLKHDGLPSYLQMPRIKTTRESIRQNCVYKSRKSTERSFGFFTQMATELGQRTYSTFASKFSNRMGRKSFMQPGVQTPKNVPVCQSLSYEDLGKLTPEKDKGLSWQRDKHESNSCALHSCLLKALLDPEYLDQCHRCNSFALSIKGTDLEHAVPCLIRHARLMDRNIIQSSGGGESKRNHQKHSKGQATGFPEPPKPSINHLRGSNESSLVALGVAMGVAFVTSGRNNDVEGLLKLLKKTNSSIEKLKQQMESMFEFDPVKPIKVEEYDESGPTKPTLPNGNCTRKAHQHLKSHSGSSASEILSLELFCADNNHASNVRLENHIRGLNELEAELEAELRLMQLNVCNTNLADHEWKQTQTQSNQESRQPEGENGVYVGMDICEPIAVQDAEQLYESDFVVPPLELERRLWQVLEQRQEERICELEKDLHITNEKVAAKEVEVRWWKDRVRWLMETSLGGKNDNLQSLLSE